MEPRTETIRAAKATFDRRYSDWLHLRAELEDATRGSDGTAMGDVEARLSVAEALLMTTPAPVPDVVWRKIEVLEQAISSGDGSRSDHAEVWMLAAVKADLLAFGIGEDRA